MAAPRTIKPEDLPTARRYAGKVTRSIAPPENLQDFIAWSLEHLDAENWRRLQSSIRQTRYRQAKRKTADNVTAPGNAIGQVAVDQVLLGILSMADKLMERRGGITKRDAADRLREITKFYASETGWKQKEAFDRVFANFELPKLGKTEG